MNGYEAGIEAAQRSATGLDEFVIRRIVEAFLGEVEVYLKSNPNRDGTYHYNRLRPKHD